MCVFAVVAWGVLHLVVYVLMRMAVLSLPPTPPLQGGDCTLYSLLRVSGEWIEPGPFVWCEAGLCFSEKCLLQSFCGVWLTWG